MSSVGEDDIDMDVEAPPVPVVAPEGKRLPSKTVSSATRQCDGCLQFGVAFKVNAAHCVKCQPELDAAERDSKRHGWNDQYKQEISTGPSKRRLLARYSTMCPSRGQGRSRTPFDFASYVEEFYTKTEVVKTAHCEMMTLDEFFAYCDNKKVMSRAEASAQWERWETSQQCCPDDPSLVWDRQGAEGGLRFAIKVADYVNFENRMGQSKSLVLRTKDKRNPTEGDVRSVKEQVKGGHEGFNGMWLNDFGGGAAPKDGLLGRGGLFQALGAPAPSSTGSMGAATTASDGDMHIGQPFKKAKKEKAIDSGTCALAYDSMQALVQNMRDKVVKTAQAATQSIAECESRKLDSVFVHFKKLISLRLEVHQIVFDSDLKEEEAREKLEDAITQLDESDRR